jgi:hypothetical protein
VNDLNRAITVADDHALSEMVRSAKRRLVVLAPALSKPIASAVAEQWHRLGAEAVTVVLDVHPEVYRLGLGDIEALKHLEKVAASLGTTLNRQPGIRIGLVIADDETLVYSPTPLLIEAGPKSGTSPNAIRLGPPPRKVEEELGRGASGVRDQVVGLDKADNTRIAEVEQSLKENPPQKFDVSRRVRVFNAAFEFVEFELSGTSIDRKTVPIPHHLLGVADDATREQLRASFRILPPNHELSGEHLKYDRDLIAKRYLRVIPGFGSVLPRSRKPDFEREVEELRSAVKDFGKAVQTKLQSAMDENRKALAAAFLPLVERTPPKEWCKSNGSPPKQELLQEFLDADLRQAFGKADDLIKQMDVRVLLKGVTYELLSNPKFMELTRKAIPELPELYDEFDAAKASARDAGLSREACQ